MMNLNPHYITYKMGKKISIVLPIKKFEALLEKIEKLEDIKLYDEAKNNNDPSIPIDEAFQLKEQNRK